jgi:hypothetical protein
MANPVILSDNRFANGTPTATDTAAGYDVRNIVDLRDFTFWQAASAGTKYLTVNCGSAKSADTLGLFGHNFFTASASVSLESSTNGSAWTQRVAPFTPVSDHAQLVKFPSASAQYWRLKMVTASIAPRIAVPMVGTRLTFPFPPLPPHVPVQESVMAQVGRSTGAHVLGVAISYFPISISVKFQNPDRTWVYANWDPWWLAYGRYLNPFFWAWDLDTFPYDVRYLQLNESMVNQYPLSMLGTVDMLALEMEGVAEIP